MSAVLDVVLLVPLTVLTVLVSAAVIRRLLGVRPGPVRTVLAAAPALVVAGPLMNRLVPSRWSTVG